jgi:hypothetical protein
MNIPDISANELRRAASIQGQIEKLQEELTSILATGTPAAPAARPAADSGGRKKKRTMSATARALISAAQKKRWATKRGTTGPAAAAKPAPKKKFTMSAAAKAAISKAAKARWAKLKAAKK